jgi:hypothetical protein
MLIALHPSAPGLHKGPSPRSVLRALTLLVAALSVTACSATSSLLVGPACPLERPRAPRGGKLFTGLVPGAFDPATRQAAFGEALSEGLKLLGVEISSSMMRSATTDVLAVDGQESVTEATTTRSDISVNLGAVEVRQAKADYCSAAGEPAQVQAFVTIPGSEWLRLVRSTSGKTVLVVGCSSEPEGGCRPEIENSARNAAQAAGFDISHAEMRSADDLPDDRDAIALSNQHGAAWVLVISLRGKTLSGDDPVFAETRSLARLIETSDGTTIRTWEPGRYASNNQPHRFKGSAFPEHAKTPEQDALSQSLQRAIQGTDRGRPCAPDDTFCEEPGVVQGMKAWEAWK